MLEDKTPHQPIPGFWLFGLANDVVENEVHISSGVLEVDRTDLQDGKPLSEEALPFEIMAGRYLNVVDQKNVQLMSHLSKLP